MKRREFITLLGGAAARGRWRHARSSRQAADHRVPGREHGFGLEPLDRRFCAAAARTRLDRGPHCRDRVSLGGGTQRRFAEIAAEFVRLKVDVILTAGTRGRRHESRRHRRSRSCSRLRATRSAPAWSRPWRDRAAMSPACRPRQPILPGSGSNFCASAPWSPPVGGHGQCRLSRLRAGDRRGSGSSPQAWPRSRRARNPARRGHRRPPSRRSRRRARHFMCVPTRW